MQESPFGPSPWMSPGMSQEEILAAQRRAMLASRAPPEAVAAPAVWQQPYRMPIGGGAGSGLLPGAVHGISGEPLQGSPGPGEASGSGLPPGTVRSISAGTRTGTQSPFATHQRGR